MSNPAYLLRMLEPTVRPDGVAGRAPGGQAPQQPIEGRDFASLLQDAQKPQTLSGAVSTATPERADQPEKRSNPLDQLNDIPNPAVLRILGAAPDNPTLS